jgi:DNA-binding GntR family transcriptional regulator
MAPNLRQADAPYLQIAAALRRQIASEALGPGDAVPSERELSSSWNVSRMTASRALGALRSEGLIYSQPGKGNFVRRVPSSAAHRYLRSLHPEGKSYGIDEVSEIRSAELIQAPSEVAVQLGLPEQSIVIRRYRVISDKSGPVELSTSWFSGDLQHDCPELLGLERLPNGMLRYIEAGAGLVASDSADVYFGELLTDEQRSDLQLSGDYQHASLTARHRISDVVGVVIAYVEAVYRPGYCLSQTTTLQT